MDATWRGDEVVRIARMLAVVASASLGMVACGSNPPAAPTSPSSGDPAVESHSGLGLTAEGLLPSNSLASTTPITVASIVSGTACPTLRFMVGIYVFKVDSSTQYTGGGCGDLAAGSKINFTGSRESETSTIFTVSQLSF